MIHDIFSDMLVRLKNALKAHHSSVIVPYSKLNEAFSKLLIDENLLKKVSILPKSKIYLEGLSICSSTNNNIEKKKQIKHNFLKDCKRISKPSNRVYVSASQIPLIENGLGIVILSTPAGLMTGKKARNLHIGGELLCKISFKISSLYEKKFLHK